MQEFRRNIKQIDILKDKKTTQHSKSIKISDSFKVSLAAERSETIKPIFTFSGNADLFVIKLFEGDILPTRAAMFFNICSIPIFFLSFIYLRAGMFFWAVILLLLAGILFIGKCRSKKIIMNYLLSIISQLFENGSEHTFCPNYTMAFFDEYASIIREDGIEIQIFYSHLNRISEKNGYIALFTKESFIFPFHSEFTSPMHKNAWLKFIRQKAPHIEFFHIK